MTMKTTAWLAGGGALGCLLPLLGCASTGGRGGSGTPIGPGEILTAETEQGATIALRIDAVENDPLDPDGDVFLYETSVRDPTDGAWKPLCLPDRDGKNRAIPLQGSWDAGRTHVPSSKVVTFACTNGSLGKCVRFGYKPWKTVNGISLAEYHQACVHMVPADYCGDGRAHTRNGTLIQVYDRLGIQKREPSSDMVFEAAWSVHGAVYVNKPRYGGEKLDELTAECPDHLRNRTSVDGPVLGPPAILDTQQDALIITESRVTNERP
jgi:hypothetical protein